MPVGIESVHSSVRHRNVNNLVQIFDDKDKGIDGSIFCEVNYDFYEGKLHERVCIQ